VRFPKYMRIWGNKHDLILDFPETSPHQPKITCGVISISSPVLQPTSRLRVVQIPPTLLARVLNLGKSKL